MTPPARNGLVESLADRIAASIRDDGLRPGDRLPSARALAEQFRVAVPTLREAIRRLEAFGLVEMRHGAGIFVRTAQPPSLLPPHALGGLDGQALLDLLDTRLLIEPYLAEQAALSGDREQVARLEAHLEEAERYLDGDDRMLQQANMAFHAGIARCAGNTILIQVMDSLVGLYGSEQAVILALYNARQRDYHEHRAILAAIRAADAAGARRLMRRHLRGVKEVVAAQLSAMAHARKVGWLASAGGGPVTAPRAAPGS
jgi:GntR family transcriptional repressor for pyruvate dehydrogenase complex